MRWRSNGSDRQDEPHKEASKDDGSAESVPDLEEEEERDRQSSSPDLEDLALTASGSQADSTDETTKTRAQNEKPMSTRSKRARSPQNQNDDLGSDQASPPDDTVWKPQEKQSKCEFSYTIKNYAEKRESGCKKAEYSGTTVDEFGNRWRLIIYVNGNGRASNNHLSLFLQVADADDLPFGWKKQVSYVLTLEHPDGPKLGYSKRNPDKMFKLCPKAIDWGWSQFITSDRIQQEGFISNDSLTVKASVTVKSSTVKIDPDDAELYLKCAVEEGNSEAVKTCLAQGANVNCKFKDDLYTPLHTACSSTTVPGSLGVLNLLLDRGADANACNKWKETPLLIAANNGHTTAVEALLRRGADPSLCSEAGWSALTFAAHKGYDDIISLLLKENSPVNVCVTEDNSTPLHKACAGSKAGHLSAAKQLLVAGADVHALNKWRETPLLTAANHGQADAVEALLKAGADPCKCTDTGWSPLSIAAYKGHDDAVRLLLEAGAPTEENDATLSALLQAATKGLPDTVELLLRHGADHTVTTKKGDTALSILVEQDMIDTAVEMVTKYKASIPRCSRDRKKVQRARLLINLRMKQMQREGLLSMSTDDETDDSDSDHSSSSLHDDNGSKKPSKKKKKQKVSRESAEAQAKAAEEALLRELEQEDEQAQKDEAAASSKRAKKKKKKERERQQRLQEEQEKREKEQQEAKERERERKLLEEKERNEREERAREQRAREAAEREKEFMRNQEKEKTEKQKQKRELDAQKREKAESAKKSPRQHESPASPSPTGKQDKRLKGPAKGKASGRNISQRNHSTPPPHDGGPMQSPKSPATPRSSRAAPLSKPRRGWEAKSPVASVSSAPGLTPNSSHSSAQLTPTRSVSEDVVDSGEQSLGGSRMSSSLRVDSSTGDSSSSQRGLPQDRLHSTSTRNSVQGPQGDAMPTNFSVELPAVSLYRQEKLAEILQRCAQAREQPQSSDPLHIIQEAWLKTIMCRWIIRAAHDGQSSLDYVIPSWRDLDLLTAFFQRQLIAESRKGLGRSGGAGRIVSMESLKEAGAAIALLCQNQAKDLVEIVGRLNEQLPRDWTDSMLGLTASEVARNGIGQFVVIDWANRAQVQMPSSTFLKLRQRYLGPPGKLLTSLFSAKMRRDIIGALTAGTTMDYRFSPATQACFVKEAAVTAELWSDPFSVFARNTFCGRFPDTDASFGGLPPFGKENGGGDMGLVGRDISFSALLPVDTMVSSLYIRKSVDLLEDADNHRHPVSCVLVLHSDCFRELNRAPTINDLTILDPRLNERHGAYVRFAEILPAGQHSFDLESAPGSSEVCRTSSLFVIMQNEAGRGRFSLNERSVLSMMQSMGVNVRSPVPESVPLVPSGVFPTAGSSQANSVPVLPNPGYDRFVGGLSPRPQRQERAVSADFSSVGAPTLSASLSSDSRKNSRRGRLFELVDDGEEDPTTEVADMDVVSGMLNNLNLFQSNPSQDVDIEAISLMGIGGPPVAGEDPSLGGLGHTGSRTTGRFGR